MHVHTQKPEFYHQPIVTLTIRESLKNRKLHTCDNGCGDCGVIIPTIEIRLRRRCRRLKFLLSALMSYGSICCGELLLTARIMRSVKLSCAFWAFFRSHAWPNFPLLAHCFCCFWRLWLLLLQVLLKLESDFFDKLIMVARLLTALAYFYHYVTKSLTWY